MKELKDNWGFLSRVGLIRTIPNTVKPSFSTKQTMVSTVLTGTHNCAINRFKNKLPLALISKEF